MTNPNLVLIAALLDRSGSMFAILEDTKGGFDSFISEQKAQPGDMQVSLFQFDSKFETVYTRKPLAEVPNLVLEPRGSTALLDALGNSIVLTGQELAALPEDERPGKVIFVVMTDGQENASVEYTLETVKKLVTTQREDYQWEFVFLGANIDSFATASQMGFAGAATMDYTASSAGVRASYGSLSSSILRARSLGAPVSFSKADRDAAKGE